MSVNPQDADEIVDGLLFLGSRHVRDHELNYWQQKNIKYVIDLSEILQLPQYDGIHYEVLHIVDSENEEISKFFEVAHNIIQKAQAEHVAVFVHCNQGISRSASVVIAYLIKYKQMTLKQAWDFTKSKRSVVFPNQGFLAQLIKFEKEVHNKETLTLGKYGQLLWIEK